MRPDGSNPAKNIDRFREEQRERYLSREEVARLWGLLSSPAGRALASESSITAIKLLILTGRRLSEVLNLKWVWVDLQAGMLRLPDTKTGALPVSLNQPALNLLRELRENEVTGDYVIPGQRSGRALVNLQKPWRRLRHAVQLDDVRLHDLRHTFASVGAGLGMSLPMIGRLLGHSQAQTTARYARLAQDPVRATADAIGSELMSAIGNGSGTDSTTPVEAFRS